MSEMINLDDYFSPFRKFELPTEKYLLELWTNHYTSLEIRTHIQISKNYKEACLLVHKGDHEEVLCIPHGPPAVEKVEDSYKGARKEKGSE